MVPGHLGTFLFNSGLIHLIQSCFHSLDIRSGRRGAPATFRDTHTVSTTNQRHTNDQPSLLPQHPATQRGRCQSRSRRKGLGHPLNVDYEQQNMGEGPGIEDNSSGHKTCRKATNDEDNGTRRNRRGRRRRTGLGAKKREGTRETGASSSSFFNSFSFSNFLQ